jgi:RNA polymerase sigma-70 factor (ECF subfamily)
VPVDSLHNDKELFRLIALGDEPAFEQLFHTYTPQLQPVILKIVKSEIAAKDIIQEVFLHLWLDRQKLPQVHEPRNWMFKIAYNRSYRYIKRLLLAQKANERIIRQQEAVSLHNTEESLAFAETSRVIQQAIHELPTQSRKIYLLSRDKGLKTTEIAAALDISPQSVKNSLYRSGQSIKDYLARQGIVVPLIVLVQLLN